MLRWLYDRTLAMAASRRAMPALATVSFVESSVFPIPPDVMLVPMILAERDRAWLIAAVCTVASVLGGAAGYLIGAWLFESIGEPVLAFYGKQAYFDEFAERFNAYGSWVVLFAGITPFPYKVITIASGATGLNFAVFMVASLIARALRFFLVAALLWRYGPPVRRFVEERLGLVTLGFFMALFGGFLAVRFL